METKETLGESVKIRILFTFITLIMITRVEADIDDGSWGLENIEEQKKQPGPFRLEAEFDYISPANFNKKGYGDQDLTVSHYTGTAGMAFCYFAKSREAYAAAVSYRYLNLKWKENPYFSQEKFEQVSFILRFFSNRFCDWIWLGQAQMNVDADHWNFNQYTDYDITVWGKYDYNSCVNLHIGTIIQTGMKMDRVYPIIGFDWDISKRWTLNAVFPVNISLAYEINKAWTSAVAMRFFDFRQRVNKDEELSMGLFSYRNSGFELVILYEKDPLIEANLHIGNTLGGMLRISDQDNRDPHHFKLDPSWYAGGEIIISF